MVARREISSGQSERASLMYVAGVLGGSARPTTGNLLTSGLAIPYSPGLPTLPQSN